MSPDDFRKKSLFSQEIFGLLPNLTSTPTVQPRVPWEVETYCLKSLGGSLFFPRSRERVLYSFKNGLGDLGMNHFIPVHNLRDNRIARDVSASRSQTRCNRKWRTCGVGWTRYLVIRRRRMAVSPRIAIFSSSFSDVQANM